MTSSIRAMADKAKAKGNAAFSAGCFDEAARYFTDAIALASGNHVLCSNRSAALASLHRYFEALADAEKTVELKPDWAKGYSCIGVAHLGLGDAASAVAAYEKGLALDPNNEGLKADLADAKKAAIQAEEGWDAVKEGIDQLFVRVGKMEVSQQQMVRQVELASKVVENQVREQQILAKQLEATTQVVARITEEVTFRVSETSEYAALKVFDELSIKNVVWNEEYTLCVSDPSENVSFSGVPSDLGRNVEDGIASNPISFAGRNKGKGVQLGDVGAALEYLEELHAGVDGSQVNLMGWEERQRQISLLSLSYHDLQCLCKRYNLPANKNHSQLASALALLLEKGKLNSGPERETLFGSTQASALLSNIKEASRCGQENLKRGPYSDRDDCDRPLLHIKHRKGPQTPMDETLKSDSGINNGKTDCFSHSSSGLGITHNVRSQNTDGLGENVIDKGSGSSDKTSTDADSFQFFVTSDDGLDLFVDLNSTPSVWVDSFKEKYTSPSTHNFEHGNFSSFISSLESTDDHNTISPAGNIVVDKQNGGAEGIAPCTNSSLGSTGGENSHSEPCPPDTTAVNSRSSASTSPESVDAPVWSEKSHAPLADDTVQPTGNRDTVSPGKTKASVKIDCTQNVLVADTSKASAFSHVDVVKNDSENSCPTSVGKQGMIDVPEGAQLRNSDTHEVLMENEPVEVVPMEEDIGYGDRLSNSSGDVLPVKDAQSDASCADHCVAGNFDLTDPTPPSSASDSAINPLTSKHLELWLYVQWNPGIRELFL